MQLITTVLPGAGLVCLNPKYFFSKRGQPVTSEPLKLVNNSQGSFGQGTVPQEQGWGAALPEEWLGKPDPALGRRGDGQGDS